jgi:hypothetical protein
MISFLAIPESLKPKVKEAFPEATFFVSEMDASTHGKPKRVRKPKIKVDTDVNGCDPVPPL